MNYNDLINLIAKFSTEKWQEMQNNVTDDNKWLKARGAYDMLEQLRLAILMKVNPHNREDIRKFNEKEKLSNS